MGRLEPVNILPAEGGDCARGGVAGSHSIVIANCLQMIRMRTLD